MDVTKGIEETPRVRLQSCDRSWSIRSRVAGMPGAAIQIGSATAEDVAEFAARASSPLPFPFRWQSMLAVFCLGQPIAERVGIVPTNQCHWIRVVCLVRPRRMPARPVANHFEFAHFLGLVKAPVFPFGNRLVARFAHELSELSDRDFGAAEVVRPGLHELRYPVDL